MRPRFPRPGLMRALGGAALIAASAPLLTACGSGPAFPTTTQPYAGPPVAIEPDDASDDHVVIITAPTGGWMARYDGREPRFGYDDVFITLISPDPTRVVTQALVRHHVDTPVPVERPLRAWVRILEFDTTLANDAPPGNPVSWIVERLVGDKPPPPYRFAAATDESIATPSAPETDGQD